MEPPVRPSKKPLQNARNADGTPKYKTYEDWIEALVEWKLQELLMTWGRAGGA